MENTAVETVLHMEDFTRYFEANRLGKLSFPNGKAYVHPGGNSFDHSSITDFYINLTDLYKLVTEWKVNHIGVPLDDIVAVIAFGSAVRYPGFTEVVKHRWFRGPVTKQVPIQPNDADFLVITGKDLMREKILKPISLHTYDCGSWIEKGGIHLVNRGVSQLLNGIQANDTVSISALQEGVPIFFNGRLGDVFARSGIINTTQRKILWDENSRGCLTGRIQ